MSASALPAITTVDELLAHAREIEAEAMERYEDLANQMETHNNPRVAKLFLAMVAVEQKQVDRMNALAETHDLPDLNPSDFTWPDLEAPECVPIGQGHYQMTEHEALAQALECETRAWAFFAHIAANTDNVMVKNMATQFADEEREHMQLVQAWIDRLPPAKPVLVDLDDPIDQE